MTEDLLQLLIGDANDRLVITVRGRMHPQATDYWDANWLVTPIDLHVGGFKGRINAALRTSELAAFRSGLATLYEALEGEAHLESIEDWLTMTLVGDGAGHIAVSGAARDQPGIGNTLHFSFTIDQTYLPPVIEQLAEIDREFPVVE